MRIWSWLGGLFRNRGVLQKPLNSLVLLVAAPRPLDMATVEQTAGEALGVEFGRERDEGTAFVMGEAPEYVLLFGERPFAVNSLPTPYFDRPDDVVAVIREPRACEAVRGHQAWLSVDLLGDAEDEALEEAYRIIGRLAAAFAGEDCLAVYAPATGQMRVWDASLAQVLAQGNPLREFSRPLLLPTLGVGPDDPRVRAAAQEARRRWPEFVGAFREQRRDQSFAVKGPVRHGGSMELAWIDVLTLEGDRVLGVLGGEPSALSLHVGDPVEIRQAEVEDWIYTDGPSVRGGFTVEAVYGAQQRA